MLGTQTFGIKYQFTPKNALLETAEAIRRMGSNTIKFIAGPGAAGQYRMTLPPGIASLTALVRDEPSFRAVLDMPFAHYLMWAYAFAGDEWRTGLSPARRDAIYREINELCAYLLTAYRGSGKTFYLGHWEGDWSLLGHTDRTKDPPPEAIRGMIDWLGGYPFGVARPEEVFHYFHDRGFALDELKTCGGRMGCNEFVFSRQRRNA